MRYVAEMDGERWVIEIDAIDINILQKSITALKEEEIETRISKEEHDGCEKWVLVDENGEVADRVNVEDIDKEAIASYFLSCGYFKHITIDKIKAHMKELGLYCSILEVEQEMIYL